MTVLETKDYKKFHVGDISFDDYHQANRCLPGDTVEWDRDGSKCILIKRADHRFLAGVLELNSKYIYGHTSRGVKIYLFHPFDTSYPPMRVGCSERDTSKNQLALVKFDIWTEKIPRGNLIRLLGPVGELEAEKEALLWLYGKPELKKIMFDVEPSRKERKKIQGTTINIDPEGCRDIDDVLTLNPLSNNTWELIITIADVAESIPADSPGDLLAREKAQTLYQNGQAKLPMLPSNLSEDKLSLLPGEERQGIALRCVWDAENQVLFMEGFEEVTLRNTASYTYDTIYKSSYPIHILKEIASFLKGQDTDDSHEWIEQFMLLYNMEGAKLLVEANQGLVRTHKPADREKLNRFEAIHPDLRVFAFEAALYESVEEGKGKIHASIGALYSHLSSPLRRYADLVNQRVLKAYLNKQEQQEVPATLSVSLNQQQKKQKKHDRDLFFLEQILKGTTGSIEGLVVESTETKTKVYVPAWKRIVKVNSEQQTVGEKVVLDYYADIRKVCWKERIVFRVVPKN